MQTATSKQLKVAIVEDNELFAQLVSEALFDQFGYSVDVYYSGEEILKHLDKKPDVILLDFQLNSSNIHSMNGDLVLKKIKDSLPSTQVVIISSQADLCKAIELLKHGACDYICKDVRSIQNIGKTLDHLGELAKLKNEINYYKAKNSKDKVRLIWLGGLMLTSLLIAYYLG